MRHTPPTRLYRLACSLSRVLAAGFYCPGYDNDDISEQPGSEPIMIDSGNSRQTVEETVVTFELELGVSLEEFEAE